MIKVIRFGSSANPTDNRPLTLWKIELNGVQIGHGAYSRKGIYEQLKKMGLEKEWAGFDKQDCPQELWDRIEER